MIKLTNPVIVDVINLVMGRGIDLTWVLVYLGLDFIKLEKTLLVPMDGYMLFYVTPIFDLADLGPHVNEWVTSLLSYLASNEVLDAILNVSYDQTEKKVGEVVNGINN